MVVGDETLLVLTWLRGLVQMLVPMMIRIISDSGSTAMVAKISESHDDDNSEVLAEDTEYMKTISNRVPIRPSDCNRGMYVWPSTVGPKPNERRSKWSGGPETLQTTTGTGPVDRSGCLNGRMFLANKSSCDALGNST